MRPRHVLALALLAAAGAARAQKVDLNVITAVEISDQGASVVLTVRGSKPPNFTTFSMADPPRFVIDLSEARFQGVPEDLAVNDGTILAVKNLSYGSESTSISRIMVAFSVDVDPPDVQAVGNDLVVRVDKPSGAGAAVARAEDAGRQEAERARAEARAKAEAEVRAQQEAEARARAEIEAELRAEAEATAREAAAAETARREVEAQASQDAEHRAREEAARSEAEAQARAEAERRVQEEAEAQARAEAERRAAEGARQEEQRRAQEEAERQRQEALAAARDESERKRQEQADRQAAEERAREEARAAAEAEKQARAEARAAAEAEKRQNVEEARAAREAERLAREEERQRKADEARQAKEAERQRREEERLAKLAAREEAQRERAREAQLSAGAPEAQLREIGFRQLPGASRVFVRTSVTPQFTIQDVGDDTVRVEIQNTRVLRRNDTRFLDTSFFPSAVAMIAPSSRGGTYVVDIKLRQRVPYQQKIEGDMLAIDFERPAGTSSAAPGLPPAADEGPGDEPGGDQPAEEAPPEEAPPTR